MQYMGSKNRIAKHILPIMLKHRKDGQYWVEPFVGGANMIDKVDGNRIGGDSNKYLIAMWKDLQNGRIFYTNISKEYYNYVKENKDEDLGLTSFIGFLCSFGGKWFGGYAKNLKGDNYAERGMRVLEKQREYIKNIKFVNSNYQDLDIPNESIIYCDPPYANTTKYKDDFDHDQFWDWCRYKVADGHTVFISEYNAPDDFKCIWEKEVKTVLNRNTQESFRVEKLFVHKSQY